LNGARTIPGSNSQNINISTLSKSLRVNNLFAFNNNQHGNDTVTSTTTTKQTPNHNLNKKQNPTHNPPENLCTETTHNNNQKEKNKTTNLTKYEYPKQKQN
jgi:hypothetical protein